MQFLFIGQNSSVLGLPKKTGIQGHPAINAAELIIALMALSKGLIGVVKASITGSIIGNILLVLGASILAGGMRFPRQTFNQTAARISATS